MRYGFMNLVKVSYPLKQGLKQQLKISQQLLLQIVKVSYPLKQGLKPYGYKK